MVIFDYILSLSRNFDIRSLQCKAPFVASALFRQEIYGFSKGSQSQINYVNVWKKITCLKENELFDGVDIIKNT